VLELSIIYHLVIGRQYKLLLQEDIRVLLQLIALLNFVLMDIVVIPYVLATVIAVMLQVLWEHAQMQIQIVLVIVIFVVQVTVQQIMLYAQIQLPHVPVLVAEPSLIVLHVLTTPMVYVDIQSVVVILAVKHMTMVLPAQPVKLVLVGLVVVLLPLV